MYNTVLIHNDNTPLNNNNNNNIENLKSIIFNPTIDDLNNSDIDTFISNKIMPQLDQENMDIVYIKDTLSENYIDFYGLIIAYHIRFSKNHSLVPIVILSEIDSYTISKLTPLGQILLTKNIFVTQNQIESFKKFNTLQPKPLTQAEYMDDFLNKIDIKPPKDYLSHHSITNEWAIYQWSQLLGVSTDATEQNKAKISSMLYFKYLENKYNLSNKTEIPDNIRNSTASVLLIDDKCDDGWSDVMSKFMKKFFSDIKFDFLGSEYRDIDEISYIEKQTKDKIIDFKPDIILLDLRLLETIDSNEDKISNISGVKILKFIKKLNPSIQIIIFSASTDSLIIDELYKIGILGYVKKDSPTNKYVASKSSSITKLNMLMKQAIEKRYLQDIWDIQQYILNVSFLTNTRALEVKILRDNILTIFEILNSNIANPFKYAMLAIYKCIELICDYYIEDKYKDAYWKDTKERINNHEDNSTKNYILNIIDKKTTLSKDDIQENIQEIVCSRNYTIHTKEKDSCRNLVVKNPDSQNIIKWFDLLNDILKSIIKKTK